MVQSARQRRAAQARTARQIREGTYQPSPIGAQARKAASDYKAAQQMVQAIRFDTAEEKFDDIAHLIGGSPDVVYEPTKSSNPSDPRTARMEYYRAARVVKVYWGDGGNPYVYMDIDNSLWTRWLKSASPGRYINRILVGKPYMPSPF